MTEPVHKVTCFITRFGETGKELLLLILLQVGVQIPAGTVNSGEELGVAARREAAEESGLNDLKLVRLLGEADDPPPQGVLLVSHPTTVYSQPDAGSLNWAHFRSGVPVEVLRHAAGITQVAYVEHDSYQNPHYVTYNIIGCVPDETLTDRCVSQFFQLTAIGPTLEQWTVTVDNTVFELFWASLNELPDLVPPQHKWLEFLTETINIDANKKHDILPNQVK